LNLYRNTKRAKPTSFVLHPQVPFSAVPSSNYYYSAKYFYTGLSSVGEFLTSMTANKATAGVLSHKAHAERNVIINAE